MANRYGMGWIPDKEGLPSKFEITETKNRVNRFQERLMFKLRYMDQHKKLFLKDYEELYAEVEKELDDEDGK